MPNISIYQLDEEMKLADKYTLDKIIDYLTIDSYELVKNIAKVVNSENAGNVIAYRDGALGRNEALKKALVHYKGSLMAIDKRKARI